MRTPPFLLPFFSLSSFFLPPSTFFPFPSSLSRYGLLLEGYLSQSGAHGRRLQTQQVVVDQLEIVSRIAFTAKREHNATVATQVLHREMANLVWPEQFESIISPKVRRRGDGGVERWRD